mmetsp:Transcript_12170/g.30803  ORF Transcript_12170/g.30803 Transcript_12170/m.30803 type:complete len:839 (-) Transcript_12170:245-2761(-)
MSNEIDDSIALAIKNLEKAINKILKRNDQNLKDKSQRRLRRLVEHARHVFIELAKKRRILKSFLLWFRHEWTRLEVDLDKYPVEILQHSLQHFLRCQDSFILLTSGECRHEHDTHLANTTNFRSRLSTLEERDDGYTVLYKGTGVYSGYGFDEFNNEVVGIRALLEKELKRYRKSPWDYLERHGGTELLESLLDQHECDVKEMQHSLQSFKQRMIEDINKRLTPKNLKFATQDKMERLSLSVQGRRIDLERRAGSFQIEGPLLPDKNRRPEDWNYCSLKLRSEKENRILPSKKRRRVIDDSESEDEMIDFCDKNATKPVKNLKQSVGKSSGLVVRIDSSALKTEHEDSLAVIKNQLGVNVHELEEAREILEGEDGNTKRVLEEEKVVRLEKILKRVLSRDEIDENEVWDAQECLRYAYMEAGNKYLWDARVRCVDKAIDNFEKAKQIVETQSKSQQQVTDKDSSLLVQLNLLYLRGQAVVNIGISLVDSCHRKISTSKAKILRAIREFETAQSLMTKLRDLVGKGTKSSRTLESTSYIFKSKQLESLACRWMGRGFWLISEEKKSIASFQQASHTFSRSNTHEWHNNTYFEEDILELAAEAIYATCDLADRCYSKMEEFQSQSSWLLKKGNEMLDIVTRALTRHIEISESIERYYCPFKAKHFRVEYDVSSIQDVTSHRDVIIKQWKDRLINKQTCSSASAKSHPHLSVKRSDIMSLTTVITTSNAPHTKSILSSDGRKKRRYNAHGKGSHRANGYRGNDIGVPSTNADAVHALTGNDPRDQQGSQIKFRKWGDGILIAEQLRAQEDSGGQSDENNSTTLVLAYPSIAPPLPLEYPFD